MVGIQENGEVEFLAQTSYKCRDLADSHKRALPFGQTNQDRHIHFTSGREDRFQQHQVGDIEVSDRLSGFLRFLQMMSQRVHKAWFPLSTGALKSGR